MNEAIEPGEAAAQPASIVVGLTGHDPITR